MVVKLHFASLIRAVPCRAAALLLKQLSRLTNTDENGIFIRNILRLVKLPLGVEIKDLSEQLGGNVGHS